MLDSDVSWFRPVSLSSLLALKAAHPDAKIVCGNTEVGVEVKFKKLTYPTLIAGTHVPELTEVTVRPDAIVLGASVNLSTLEEVCLEQAAARPVHEGSGLRAIAEQLRWFAGRQIRNVSAIGGNVVTGSPISDLNPLWISCGATFVAVSAARGRRSIPARAFFKGYRKVDLQPDEVLLAVELPVTAKYEYVHEFKQSHRRDDDIAIVTAGMRVRFAPDAAAPGGFVAAEVHIALGGMAPMTVPAPKAEAALAGKPWEDGALQAALAALAEDVPLPKGVPGGMSEYRQSLAASFLFKFYVFAAQALEKDAPGYTAALTEADRSALPTPLYRPAVRGLQYTTVRDGKEVGQPIMHASAELQVTGEAKYVDDIPVPAGMLHAALVLSEKPHARITVDASAARAAPGVAGYYGSADVPGGNDIGAILHDEEVFATDTVTCAHQIIGIVVADTEAHAQAAAQLVKVTYEELPAILSVDDAIEAGSFFEAPGLTDHGLESGDVDGAMAGAAHVLEGVVRCGGQEHFYLEPHSTLMVPYEGEEMHMFSSTQCPDKHQRLVSHVLGLPASKVVCRTKRLGGGFGGKETRSAFIACAAAVPAYHLRRPVRVVCDRDVDMCISGQRHAFKGEYKVGFDADGRILALDMMLYNNAGNSLDLSGAIMDRALLHSDSVYRIPNLRVNGKVCKTNMPSNTAFRGFGGPQGVLLAEMWMERVAAHVGRPLREVQELNMYEANDMTHFGQRLVRSQAKACWQQALGSAGFDERRAAVDAFNAGSRYRKRGLAASGVKFGISFTATFMNQAGALVHLYRDGTCLVSHGGTEMGQGLHTKMAQVAATVLGISTSQVFIAETATDKVPNASPTAASASSDLYGAAVKNACMQLSERLKPVREAKGPDASFAEVCDAAYFEQIDLSAHGFYKTPDIYMDWDKKSGVPFNYFCYGAAVTEVEVDCLTGDTQVLRTDIVMDVGDSLNPALDVGQVEGGYVQGMGWLLLEELKWGDKEHPWIRPGQLFTRGPGAYKIPSVNDVPTDFRVALLHNAPNPSAVYSSKAVGEPPFLLANGAFFAVKDAVRAARLAAGHEGYVHMDAPATPERVRMACADAVSARFAGPDLRPNLSV